MSQLSVGLKKIERGISSLIPHEGAAEKRANMYATRDQIALYKSQQDELTKKADALSEQTNMERQRVHEKQIRGLRNSYRRRSGLMAASSGDAPNEQLG
jgi:hypothetical protein